MTFTAVGALPLSGQIHQQLLEAILAGRLTGTLPPERELAATFQVNRHAVREAVKRLQQARLVEVNQGGATRVLPVREHARLDLLPDLVVRDGVVDPRTMRDIMEMRAGTAADAARLCALRSPEVGRALAVHIPGPDLPIPELEAGNLAYWTAIIDGSGNLAYRLALNTLVAGFAAVCAVPSGADIIAALHEEYRRADAMRELADAISAQDATAAQRIAADLLGSVAV